MLCSPTRTIQALGSAVKNRAQTDLKGNRTNWYLSLGLTMAYTELISCIYVSQNLYCMVGIASFWEG